MTVDSGKYAVPLPGLMAANLTCFAAMAMWSFAFPIAQFLLQSWGVVALVLARQSISVAVLLLFWLWIDGRAGVAAADWRRGLGVGGIGFGLGSTLFLAGQHLSDAVTPAIAAAMMPIVGALLEVSLDKRRMTARLWAGITLALLGGLLATGSRLGDGNFGWGGLLCLVSVILFAWATRATTRDFESLSHVGRTTITLAGSVIAVTVIYLLMLAAGLPGLQLGSMQPLPAALLVFTSIASLALAQFLWIRGAAGLGILLASLHVNAVPFYVMVIVVLFLDAGWNWWQAAGAAVVAAGVILSQSGARAAPRP